MSEWSDSKKWWADLLKSIVAFAVVAFLTFTFLNKLEDARQKANFKWQANYGIKVQVLRSFEQESKKYMLVGYDAMREYTCSKTRYTSKIIEEWEDERYDSLKIARESLEFWFSSSDQKSLSDAIKNFKTAQNAIWNLRSGGYLTECRSDLNYNVKLYQDQQWDEYDKKQFSPLRKRYYESVNSILHEAALQLPD